jgi:GxxExxY protein
MFEVYKEMGSGFIEPVYQECLERELANCGMPFAAQRELRLRYKDETLTQIFKPDLICFEKIIIEVKAVRQLAPEHRAQLINYLKATGLRLGLLVNFDQAGRFEINPGALGGRGARQFDRRRRTESGRSAFLKLE